MQASVWGSQGNRQSVGCQTFHGNVPRAFTLRLCVCQVDYTEISQDHLAIKSRMMSLSASTLLPVSHTTPTQASPQRPLLCTDLLLHLSICLSLPRSLVNHLTALASQRSEHHVVLWSCKVDQTGSYQGTLLLSRWIQHPMSRRLELASSELDQSVT